MTQLFLSRRRLLGAGAALGGLALAGCAGMRHQPLRSAAWSSSAAASAAAPPRATCACGAATST
jgi:hypothetical protein